MVTLLWEWGWDGLPGEAALTLRFEGASGLPGEEKAWRPGQRVGTAEEGGRGQVLRWEGVDCKGADPLAPKYQWECHMQARPRSQGD